MDPNKVQTHEVKYYKLAHDLVEGKDYWQIKEIGRGDDLLYIVTVYYDKYTAMKDLRRNEISDKSPKLKQLLVDKAKIMMWSMVDL